AAVAGYPNITVPCGYVAGLPVGISFFGRAWSEPTLIKIAFAYEHATRCRQAPRFLTTLNGAPTSRTVSGIWPTDGAQRRRWSRPEPVSGRPPGPEFPQSAFLAGVY